MEILSPHHDCCKSEDLSIILQHLDEVFLVWLRYQGETGLLAVFKTTKTIVGRERLGERAYIQKWNPRNTVLN